MDKDNLFNMSKEDYMIVLNNGFEILAYNLVTIATYVYGGKAYDWVVGKYREYKFRQSFFVTINGVVQTIDKDFKVTGKRITFNKRPKKKDKIFVQYSKRLRK